MTKRVLGVGTVLLIAAVILTSCSGVGINVLENKDNLLFGIEFVNVYVTNFKNTDEVWKQLEQFAENYHKDQKDLQIIFYVDRDKVVSLDSDDILDLFKWTGVPMFSEPILVNSDSEGVAGVYVRFRGQSQLKKNKIYTTSTQ